MQTFGKHSSEKENSQDSDDRHKGWLGVDGAAEIYSCSAWR